MKYEKIAEYSNTKFRRITGVKRATFDKMVEILRKGYAEKHRRRWRKPKLSIEDLLLATLEYLREYRTYAHNYTGIFQREETRFPTVQGFRYPRQGINVVRGGYWVPVACPDTRKFPSA